MNFSPFLTRYNIRHLGEQFSSFLQSCVLSGKIYFLVPWELQRTLVIFTLPTSLQFSAHPSPLSLPIWLSVLFSLLESQCVLPGVLGCVAVLAGLSHHSQWLSRGNTSPLWVVEELSAQIPSPCWDMIWTSLSPVSCMLSQPPWVHMCSCIAMSRRHYFLLVNTVVLTFFPHPFKKITEY